MKSYKNEIKPTENPSFPHYDYQYYIRYLAAGPSHRTLSLYFMVGRATISKMIPRVLEILVRKLRPRYGQLPR